ncbi:MAG: trypsin-like serine protease [Deltaproteobacteria bacterium]|nr:trypsin-like serine protease [Deltaproteobacteria bacterium]
MHHRPTLLAAVCLAASLSAACTLPGDEPSKPALGMVSAAIEGGVIDELDTHVVGVMYVSPLAYGTCTGTLIAPNLVLTAQHCVREGPTGAIACGTSQFGTVFQPDEIWITTETTYPLYPSQLDQYATIAEVLIPDGATEFCGRDVAALVLTEPLPDGVATPIVPRIDEPATPAEPYAAVGYGALHGGNDAPTGSRYRRDGLVVDCVGEACTSAAVVDREWQGETGICLGDSGGPALDASNRVFGVASRGPADCSSPVYGHVASFSQWLADAALHAAAVGGFEAPPWATGWPTDPAYGYPVGDPCTGPDECESNLCLEDYCTRMCSDEAPCPDGYDCGEDGLCALPAEPAPPGDDGGDEAGSCSLGRPGAPAGPPTSWLLLLLALGGLTGLRRGPPTSRQDEPRRQPQ